MDKGSSKKATSEVTQHTIKINLNPQNEMTLKKRKMRYSAILILTALSVMQSTLAQSNLLEGVKRNPKEAIVLCKQFRSLNVRGISAGSKQSIQEISRKRNISVVDAEILSTYVRGLHCPDVT